MSVYASRWRLRAQLDRFTGRLQAAPAELAALALLALGALAVIVVLWLHTPGATSAEQPAGPVGIGEPVTVGDPAEVPAGGAEGGPVEAAASGAARGTVVVHVAGAVLDPGLHEVPDGARIADAIEAAGGPTVDAVLDGLNLARFVHDGEQLLVPDAAAVQDGGALPAGQGAAGEGRVNVNRATAAELEALPGVGPVIAEAVVAHRDAHGPFASVDDLVAVTGIGAARVEALREHVEL